MPRLLIATTVPDTIEAFLLPYADHFRRLGWTVDALTSEVLPRSSGIRAHFDAVYEAQWRRNPLDPANFLVATKQVRACVAQGRYDIVHVHTPVASFLTRLALRGRKIGRPQVVYTAHGFHFHPGGKLLTNVVYLAAERLAGRWTDYLVVMNRDDESAARRHRFVSPEKLAFMPGIGVDTVKYSPRARSPDEREKLRQELGLAPAARYVLLVGELIPRKRPADAVEGFARVAARVRDLHLLVVGRGPLEAELRERVRAKALEGSVHFLGVRNDVPSLLRGASALVLGSSQEGLPRCVLEAMASGVPCVASDIRGTSDLLADGCGHLFPLGDVAGLAASLERILTSADVARELARRAQAKVQHYDLRHVIGLHERLYADALANRASDGDAALTTA